jgi:hypothetical protein
MHPVHQDVDMRVPTVSVRHNHRLVFAETKPAQDPARDLFHQGTIHLAARIEA